MAARHVYAAQQPRPRRRARAAYKLQMILAMRNAVPDWQDYTRAELARIISKQLENEKPGQWLPATVAVYLRKLG